MAKYESMAALSAPAAAAIAMADRIDAETIEPLLARIRELEELLREWRDVQCDQVMSLRFMRRVDAALTSQSDRGK